MGSVLSARARRIWHVARRTHKARGTSHLALVFVGVFLLSVSVVRSSTAQTDAAVLQQHAKEGERALAEGRYADAQKAYETLRQLSPATAEVHARLGLIYFQQGKYREAVPALRQAIKLKPGLPKVDALLGMSLSELGQYEEALPAVTKAFSQAEDPVLRRMAGLHLQRIYTGLGRDQDAVEVSLRLSRLHPDDPEVLYHSGRLLANLAYLQTMKLATIAPESIWLHLAAGEANESQGLYNAALREYREVLSKSPRRPGVNFRIGRVLLARATSESSNQDAIEARKAFEDELAVDSTNANAAYELGEMDRKAGEFESARKRFQQAVANYPAFEQALVGLGRTLVALGQPAEALPHLKAAVTSTPEDHVAYYQLAQAYRALGNTVEQEKALAEFHRLRSLTERRTAAVPDAKRDVTPQVIDAKPPK
jgi:tetratricopeptide (TPR) repeat protein